MATSDTNAKKKKGGSADDSLYNSFNAFLYDAVVTLGQIEADRNAEDGYGTPRKIAVVQQGESDRALA